jgi:hypothetical protein
VRVIVLGLVLAICPAWASDAIRLQDSVEVQRDTVRLADLLPENSPAKLKAAAEKVNLGRAPRPGSVRFFLASQIIPSVRAFPEVNVPKQITVRRAGWAVPRRRIRDAIGEFLAQQGLRELPEASDLHWSVISNCADPELDVVSVRWNGVQQQLEFLLHCRRRADCSKFVVEAPVSEEVGKQFAGTRTDSVSQSNSQFKPPTLIRPGTRAMLTMEGAGMRISVPVICLERGSLRQIIRARESGGQRVFSAQVVGAGLLWAKF